MSNEEIFLKEFDELKGQFVITESNRIERFIAIGDDGFDYYYVTWDGKKESLVWNTCVGRIMPLKGHLRDQDYNELIRSAKLNHLDIAFDGQITEYIKDILLDLKDGDKFLTEPCFDLN